jgi:hypothetical protein
MVDLFRRTLEAIKYGIKEFVNVPLYNSLIHSFTSDNN